MSDSHTDASDAYSKSDDPAMSLINRYAMLGDEANAMRKQREALQEDIESMKDAERALEQEDARLRRVSRKALETTEAFHAKIQDLETDYQQIKDAMNRATVERDAARRRRDNLLNHINKERLGFLEKSVEFRTCCKRLRVSALACGLEQADIQAHMEANGLDIAAAAANVCDGQLGGLQLDDDLQGDPALWKTDAADEEMTKQMEIYLEKKRLHDNVAAEVDQAECNKQIVRQRVHDRQAQEDNLHGQAERIANDNAEVEMQIQELQRLTNESEQKKALLVRRKSVTNPYMQKKNKKSMITPSPVPMSRARHNAPRDYEQGNQIDGRALSDDRRSQLQNIAMGANMPRNGTGRSRRNQEFGSRLQVDGGVLQSFEDDFETDYAGSAATPRRAMNNWENDDDDDEDVLNFVAFRGKKSAK